MFDIVDSDEGCWSGDFSLIIVIIISYLYESYQKKKLGCQKMTII